MTNSNPIYPLQATRFYTFAVRLTLAMHFFGFLGMAWATTRPFFEFLTPLNLVLNTFFLLYFQVRKSPTFYFFCLSIFLLGWGVEVWGIQTQNLFGAYTYGETLGFGLWGVPWVMGCNWLNLILLIGNATNKLITNALARVFLGATALTLLDVLIEPVAIFHDFWYWEGALIPLQNYVVWWLVGFLFLLLFQGVRFEKKNPYNNYLLIAQVLFFLAHNLLYLVKNVSQ